MDWQPIETAPKDKRILLYYPNTPFTGCNMQLGRWGEDKYAAKPMSHWSNDQSRIWGRTALKKIWPTHWAEIPPPAEQQTTAASDCYPSSLMAIGELIRTQDNRSTDQPMFVVQEKVRDAGYDSAYASDYVWVDFDRDHKEADERTTKRLDALDADGRKRGAWERVYYIDRWEFVTACFTEQGCKDFIEWDGHNHGELRIYADGSYRNQEFRTVRDFLKGLQRTGVLSVARDQGE